MSEGGLKQDQEKVQLELLSPIWLRGVGQVLTFGARKYAAHNWRKGIERSRLLGACLRHVIAYLGGEDRDPETGLLHLYHASCCLMFASELHETHPELDDRYKNSTTNAGDRCSCSIELKLGRDSGSKCIYCQRVKKYGDKKDTAHESENCSHLFRRSMKGIADDDTCMLCGIVRKSARVAIDQQDEEYEKSRRCFPGEHSFLKSPRKAYKICKYCGVTCEV